jgi:acetyl esterase/lipase
MKRLTLLLFVLAGTAFQLHAQAPKPFLPAGTQIHRDLAYLEGGHARQKLNLYLPSPGSKPYPLVIWIHGGGWKNGSKDGNPPALRLLEYGYAVASIGYRLSGDALFPAQIEDCQAAVRWLRAHAPEYGIDPDHFGAWGSSAGGHLVALLGTSGNAKAFGNSADGQVSTRVQAVCDYYGPTDFLQMGGRHAEARSPESLLLGGPIAENKDKAAQANPLTYVDKEDPPFLIVHGTEDPAVPFSQSILLKDALEKRGVPVEFLPLEGAGHGGRAFADPDVIKKVEKFFGQHLKR